MTSLADDAAYLASKGLTPEEYRQALPIAIEQMRGSSAASNADRRQFLVSAFEEMLARGLLTKFERPQYGDDTVYRLTVAGLGDVAIIQKGCPDGTHSSVNWSAPTWAVETYLWWLCSSRVSEPGVHIAKGVNRLRQHFFSETTETLDGIIFHNELCGSAERPCPKKDRAISIGGSMVPPPCVYIMPERRKEGVEWNWDGSRNRRFPTVFLAMFGIQENEVGAYVGYVGFKGSGDSLRSTITSPFGPGRSTTYRS